jgi:hypothetical protein
MANDIATVMGALGIIVGGESAGNCALPCVGHRRLLLTAPAFRDTKLCRRRIVNMGAEIRPSAGTSNVRERLRRKAPVEVMRSLPRYGPYADPASMAAACETCIAGSCPTTPRPPAWP